MTTQTLPLPIQTVLADRFISTEIDRFTLVFPSIWVAEILRIERSHILDLPFYNPLLMGIVHHQGLIIPLVSGSRLLKVDQFGMSERSIVIRLNEMAGSIANIGIVVDRAISTNTHQELPPELFTESGANGLMLMMRPELIPIDLWQPRV
jgi:chemotaxis signal transduction protein